MLNEHQPDPVNLKFTNMLEMVEGGETGQETEYFVSFPVTTREQKIIAAKYLEQAAREVFKFTSQQAKKVGKHELKHALSDEGQGFYMLAKNHLTKTVIGKYWWVGDRSILDKMRINLAPGLLEMSSKDQKNILTLVKQAAILNLVFVLEKVLEKMTGDGERVIP